MRGQHIVCPQCKTIFQVNGQLLTDTSLEIWHAAGPRFWRGQRMTLRQIAEAAHYSQTTVRRHLLRLAKAGLVKQERIGSNSNQRRAYYMYHGCLITDNNTQAANVNEK